MAKHKKADTASFEEAGPPPVDLPAVGDQVVILDQAAEKYITAVVARVNEDGSLDVRTFPPDTDAVPYVNSVYHESQAPEKDQRLYVTWLAKHEAEEHKRWRDEQAKVRETIEADLATTTGSEMQQAGGEGQPA